MKALITHLREKLELKPRQTLVEMDRMRTSDGSARFRKKMFELREDGDRVIALYDAWMIEERGNGFFGYFRYNADGDLMGRRTFIIRRRRKPTRTGPETESSGH
ncbi:hypothetical protein [Marinobacter bohaiensis]|uniref:hypothetical protein n=1 Tax=Marinobacter bohaiensis TaxID=2201898 RepID=UPI000DABE6B0|nr:hypothetical protein [Marinobacter bohaiensis]